MSLEYINYVTKNKNALNESTECACIYCKKYHPSKITEWDNDTAICTYCSVDAIVPNITFKYTDYDLLKWYCQGFIKNNNLSL